jgi:hypothetical protein
LLAFFVFQIDRIDCSLGFLEQPFQLSSVGVQVFNLFISLFDFNSNVEKVDA